MNFEEYEKEIRSVILSAISKSDDTTIFERVCDMFKSHFEKPATNITEIRKRGTKGFLILSLNYNLKIKLFKKKCLKPVMITKFVQNVIII